MAYDYRSQEEKDRENYLKYGTTDEKRIEQIKKERKSNTSFYIVLIILVFIVPMILMGMVQKCTGSKYSPFNNAPWSPRHTQVVKPVKNNVNNSIFTPSSACYIINKV